MGKRKSLIALKLEMRKPCVEFELEAPTSRKVILRKLSLFGNPCRKWSPFVEVDFLKALAEKIRTREKRLYGFPSIVDVVSEDELLITPFVPTRGHIKNWWLQNIIRTIAIGQGNLLEIKSIIIPC